MDKTNGAEGTIASAAATMTSALPPTTKRLYVYVCIYRDETSFIINFLSLISLFFSENQRLSIRTRTKTPIWLITLFGDDYSGAIHVLWCGSVRMRKLIYGFKRAFVFGKNHFPFKQLKLTDFFEIFSKNFFIKQQQQQQNRKCELDM